MLILSLLTSKSKMIVMPGSNGLIRNREVDSVFAKADAFLINYDGVQSDATELVNYAVAEAEEEVLRAVVIVVISTQVQPDVAHSVRDIASETNGSGSAAVAAGDSVTPLTDKITHGHVALVPRSVLVHELGLLMLSLPSRTSDFGAWMAIQPKSAPSSYQTKSELSISQLPKQNATFTEAMKEINRWIYFLGNQDL
ncbi:hypothetical protein V6N11_039289 [Hibiscus sabdariffa]|uniref:Uncharacterized protein n=1 Tax=Hibiscus sabdariffa TaxID=183260 RepID=A0ABR2SN65_9ROSI